MKPNDVLRSVGEKFGKLRGGAAGRGRSSGRASSGRRSDEDYDDYEDEDYDDYEDDYGESDDGGYDGSENGGYEDGYSGSEDDGYAEDDDRYENRGRTRRGNARGGDEPDDSYDDDGSYDDGADDDDFSRSYEEAFAAREERYRTRHLETLEARKRQLRQRILILAAVVAVLVIVLVIVARSGGSGSSSRTANGTESADAAAMSGTESSLSGTVSGAETAAASVVETPAAEDTGSSVSSYTNYAEDRMPAVALTFDDGPKSGNTNSILDVLEQYNAHATFFVLGQNCEANSDALKRAVSLGCEIGSHTWDHESLRDLSASERQEEYSKANDAIEEYAGVTPTLIRPPYGADNQEIKDELDIPIILWHLDTLDWKTKDADETYNAIDQDLHEGDIVLMHDIQDSTVEAIPRIVPMLVNKGYKLLTVTELYDYYGEDLTLHMNHSYSGPNEGIYGSSGTSSDASSSESSSAASSSAGG